MITKFPSYLITTVCLIRKPKRCQSFTNPSPSDDVKYGFCNKSFQKDRPTSDQLNNFTTYLSSLLGLVAEYNSNHAIKVFNSTELHFSEIYFFQNWYFSISKVFLDCWNNYGNKIPIMEIAKKSPWYQLHITWRFYELLFYFFNLSTICTTKLGNMNPTP